ncbi:conjugal transfer protein TraM [Candidatus Hamiltonella defensa]|uniref:conjugal transfer protein TraM n=1 Tax=Candidatus Williamhamiltonella defendens TaxID=138072 RepID=UPI0015840161|nr:conjugal transfer protein TraM [Candidatus Hamiltonella defensa]
MIDFDEIRKEVAIKHSVLLGKDDPILVTVTVSEMVLGRYLDLVSAQYEDANRALAVSLQQQVEQSKETAGKIITDASNYVSEQVRKAVVEALNEVGGDLKRQINNAQTASRDAVTSGRDAQTAKNSAFLAAVVAGAAALIAVAAVVVVLVK